MFPLRTLRLACDGWGGVRAVERSDLDFAAIRRQFAVGASLWPELIEWVDTCPQRFEFGDVLDRDGISLWSFVRLGLVTALARALPDAEAVAEALRRSGASRLEVEQADAHWAAVACATSLGCGVEVTVGRRSGDRSRWGEMAGRAAVHAARLGLGAVRLLPGRLSRGAAVLALGYSTWRRVTGAAGIRYIDPGYTPVLDELRRRQVPDVRVSLPTANRWRTEAVWLRHGDPDAVPVEVLWAAWWLGPRGRRARLDAAVRRRLLKPVAARVRQTRTPWRGMEASPLVGPLVDEALLRQVPRGLCRVHFFEDLLDRLQPASVLLTSEYSGAALAATIAARHKGVPVVAVQHGVIWPGHPGYVGSPTAHGWLARPNVVCVYGSYEYELLTRRGGFGSAQVVVTGAPRFDLPGDGRPRGEIRARVLAALGLPAGQPLVLFTSVGEQSSAVAQRLVSLLRASPEPVSVVVKLHPIAEDQPGAYAAAAAGLAQVRVVGEEFDLYELLRAVDVHASTNSTVLTEACVFDLPNLMVCGDMFGDTIGYLGRDVAVAAEPYGSLRAAVDAVLGGSEAERLRQGRPAFVAKQFHRLDGGASGRVADVMMRLATQATSPRRAEPGSGSDAEGATGHRN